MEQLSIVSYQTRPYHAIGLSEQCHGNANVLHAMVGKRLAIHSQSMAACVHGRDWHVCLILALTAADIATYML